jgi:hypothetical protein
VHREARLRRARDVGSGGPPLQAQPHSQGVRLALPHLPCRHRLPWVCHAYAAPTGRVLILPYQHWVHGPLTGRAQGHCRVPIPQRQPRRTRQQGNNPSSHLWSHTFPHVHS